MRNLKKLLALIVAVTTILTFTVPAFAADATTAAKTDAQVVTDLGVVLGSGSGVTADYLASQPDRVQGAIMFLRLKGLEATAKAFTGTDNFSDVSKLSATNKAILAYLKANPDLGFIGIGGGKYDPLAKMTAKQYYKIMLMALGYTYSDTDATADFNYNTIMSKAVAAGLTKLVDNEKFTVNDLAVGTVEALKANVKGGAKTLVAQMAEANADFSAKAVTAGLYTAAATPLAVVSATADNAKVAKIVFNKEIDKDSVTTSSTIKATGLDSLIVGADKKTVYAVMTAAQTQSTSIDFTIDGVKDLAGAKIAKTVKTITFVDTTIPTITGAVATNAKTIVLSANEPLQYNKTFYQVLSEVKIDGVAAIAKATVDYEKNTITLDLSTNMTAGTHKLDIKDIKDFANYTAPAVSFNVDVAADTTAPSIASAQMNNINEIQVTFNEDIGTVGTFWVNGTQISGGNVAQQTDKKVFKITLPTALDISAIVEVKVEYQNQKDVVGNEVKDKTAFTFKVADDTTLPTVTAAIGSDNKITLTFSKSMFVGAPGVTAPTIKVLKTSDSSQLGSTVTVTSATFKADTNNTVIEIAPATSGLANVDPTDIKVNVKGMQDATVRKNSLAEQNIALKANDTKQPTVVSGFSVTAGDTAAENTVTFYFSEPMEATTLNNLSNYVVTTGTTTGSLAALGNCSVKSVAADGKSIEITVPGVTTGFVFSVFALKDAIGNMSVTTTGVIALSGSDKSLNVLSAKAVANNKIEVYFDKKVGTIDPSAFIVTYGGIAKAVFTGVTLSDTATMASFTVNQDLGTTFTGMQLLWNNPDLAKNIYGTKVTTSSGWPVNITDAVAPTVSVAAGTTAGSIVLTFSENVSGTAIEIANDLMVRKADGTLVTVTSGDITLPIGTETNANFTKIVIANSDIKAATTYTVEIIGRVIVDQSGNKVAALAKTSVTTN